MDSLTWVEVVEVDSLTGRGVSRCVEVVEVDSLT